MTTKFLELIQDLREATANGKVIWEDTADESMFRTVLGHGMIRIGKGDESESAYTVWLLRPDGTIADEIEVAVGTPEFEIMTDLYDMARRSVRGADDLLESMIDDLAKRTVRSAK